MNIIQKITNYFKKSYWSSQNTLLLGNDFEKVNNRDLLNIYSASFLVSACIKKIAEKVAMVNLHLYKVKGTVGKEKIEKIKDHPLLDLLAQVNPYTTKFELLEDTITYLRLLGNAYWIKVRNERTGEPLELWTLRPDWVTIIQDDKNIIKEYEYTLPNGTTQRFKAENIIHFKTGNPCSFLYGESNIKPLMDIIRSSIFANKWNAKFFYNNARPDTLIISKTRMTAETKKEIGKEWHNIYGGIDNAHKAAILDGDIEVKTLGATLKDMDFSNLTNTTRDQILMAFGVPKTLLGGTEDVNRATADSAIYVFLSEVIEPEIKRIVDKLNEFLVPEFGDDLYLDYDDPTPENRKVVVEEYESALKNNWMVINEVRDREGLPPLKGGWDFYLSAVQVPAGGLKKGIDPKEYEKWKQEKEQDRLRTKVLAGKRSLKLKMKLKGEIVKMFNETETKISTKTLGRKDFERGLTEDQKRALWKEHDRLLLRDERTFLPFVRNLFREQEERVQDKMLSEAFGRILERQIGKQKITDKKADEIIGKMLNEPEFWEVERQVFVTLSIPIFTEIMVNRGKRVASMLGLEYTHTQRTARLINRKTIDFAQHVNATTRIQLRKTLAEGVQAGEGIPKLSKRIGETYKERRGWQAVRIARTEVLSASNGSTFDSYMQSEVVKKKEWIAVMDDRTRDNHINMHGEVRLKGRLFSNGLMYPGGSGPAEEVINCRCMIIPILR